MFYQTSHASKRIQQRSISKRIDLILEYGTTSNCGSIIFMQNKSVNILIDEEKAEINRKMREIKIHKSRIQKLEKSKNIKLVVCDDTLITAYKMTKRGRKKCRIQMESAA